MRIAVNTRLLLKNRLDGIGWFTLENFSRIAKDHPEVEFHFIFDRSFSPEFVSYKNIIPHVIGPPARHPWLIRMWYDLSVPFILKKIRPDLFVSPDAICSLTTSVPQLLVIHDLNFVHYPDDMPAKYSRFFRRLTPKFISKAKRIATVSEFSRQDIIRSYGVDPEKIDVVYNGVNESFSPLSANEIVATREEFTDGDEYFVAVSSLHPRKNLTRLLEAYEVFRKKHTKKVRLVLAGQKFWLNEEMELQLRKMKYRDDVIFTGWLTADKLHKVVAASLASIYVSYFEGFGIPVVEAFRCGVPVITSKATALPEVAGDAAYYVDPFSVVDIAAALEELTKNESLRNSLVQRGYIRVKEFSWQHTSELMWKSILKTNEN